MTAIFKNDLDFSIWASAHPVWNERLYPAWFQNFVQREVHNEDGPDQRDGIDVRIHLTPSCSGLERVVLIDEKVRRQEHWDDVFLEIWSNYERRSPGWANPAKALRSSHIAYANFLTGQAILLPVQQLQAAVARNLDKWLELSRGYKVSPNQGYKTHGVVVRTEDLKRDMADAMFASFPESPEVHKLGPARGLEVLRNRKWEPLNRAWRAAGNTGYHPDYITVLKAEGVLADDDDDDEAAQ